MSRRERTSGSVRTPLVQVLVTRWDWDIVDVRDGGTPIDLTPYVLSYQFQKNISQLMGQAQIEMFPQRLEDHILDEFNPMDVVTIREWGRTVFVGYIRSVAYAGSIGRSGEPSRKSTITATSMSGLLQESSLGLGIGNISGDPLGFSDFAVTLWTELIKATMDGSTGYREITKIIMDNWLGFVSTIGGSQYANYFSKYIDYQSAMDSSAHQQVPRVVQSFVTGTEQELSLYSLLNQVVESPFNELWSDVGPREVVVNAATDKSVSLADGVSYLVMRPTPFDDFAKMETRVVPLDHLVSFSLNKSMDEVYSVFMATPGAFAFNDIVKHLLGEATVSSTNLNKYLYKIYETKLFYYRTDTQKGGEAASVSHIESEALEKSKTLKRWFENNDQYLSGNIGMATPRDEGIQPRIGERIGIEGIEGSFYLEGETHRFSYGGQLMTDLAVTRGYNHREVEPMKLSNKLFKKYSSGVTPQPAGGKR